MADDAKFYDNAKFILYTPDANLTPSKKKESLRLSKAYSLSRLPKNVLFS
jgi:hypothetical protein